MKAKENSRVALSGRVYGPRGKEQKNNHEVQSDDELLEEPVELKEDCP